MTDQPTDGPTTRHLELLRAHEALFSLWESVSTPENQKLAALWQQNEPLPVATDLYRHLHRQEISIILSRASFDVDSYRQLKEMPCVSNSGGKP